ncbi:MAG: DNA cytosine methyltransferase [Gemmatimonadales bacterium]|jgi:DNA (cytosine-5)-methyltransferase 1
MTLVLSLFPGIGLLDLAFELEGFCVVRGPDSLWGGDVRTFHPPAGRFDGVIGGPPCQRWSRLVNLVRHVHGEDAVAECLIPEFERVVAEAGPEWWLMENVPEAPVPAIDGYEVHSLLVDNRWVDDGTGIGQEQQRVRRWSFGDTYGRRLDLEPELAVLQAAGYTPTVTANATSWVRVGGSGKPKPRRGRPESARSRQYLEAAQRAQGLPEGWSVSPPLTVRAAVEAVGNGVPIPMGRALARAVRRATA